MTTFAWVGRTRTGQIVKGERAADSRESLTDALRREQILVHLRKQLEAHRVELARLRDEIAPMIATVVAEKGLKREGMMWELVRELGERSEQAVVSWLEDAIHRVETLS